MNFGALIIGDEILSGRRSDKHLAKLIELLGARGLKLSWARYAGDDFARLTETLRQTFATGKTLPIEWRLAQLGEIDRRVRYLSKRLEVLRVVDTAPADREAVFFGAEVLLENIGNGEPVLYRIVGPDETDAQRGWISIDAPLARAMLKKRVDDEFDAVLPGGIVHYLIIEIRYDD